MLLHRLGRLALTAALVAAPPAIAAAQETPNQATPSQDTTGQPAANPESRNHLYPKLEFAISGSLLIYSTVIRADPTAHPGLGTEVGLESDLGSARNDLQPRGALRWRPGRRHEIEVGFLRANRSSERVIDRTLTFRDTSFTVGASVATSIRTSQAFLNYRYAFRVRDNSQIGATLGIGVIFLRTTLDAVTASGATSYSSESKLNGPIGSVGLYGRFKIGERWYLEGDGRGVYIAISNFTGTVVEGGAAIRRFFSNTFGAELGYNIGFYKVTFDRPASGSGFLGEGFTGTVKYTVNGIRGGVVIQL